MKKEIRKQKKGISLIALIITIIVIVLLAAIVVNTSINTPASANLAKFMQDMGEVQQAVALSYMDEYTVLAAQNPGNVDEGAIYESIAKGAQSESVVYSGDPPLGEMGIEGANTAWKIQGTEKIAGLNELPNYDNKDYYITDNGIVFLGGGYINGGNTYYNSKTSTEGEVVTPPVVDTQSPEGSMAIVNEANPMNATNGISPNIEDNITSRNITLEISASDNITTTENLKVYIKENDNIAPLSDDIGWEDYTGERMPYTLATANDGNKTIYVWYKDEAGNVSEVNSDSAYLREWDLSKVVVHNVDGTKIPIPIGYVASTVESAEATETTINGGLVIKEGTDGSRESGINEFVWIPVPVVTDMYRMNGEQKVGQLWAMSKGNNFGTKNTSYSVNSGLREPAIVDNGACTGAGTSYDGVSSNVTKMGIEGVTTGAQLRTYLQDEFDNMIESVEKYGGFYIGRYELGYNSGVVCQKNVNVLTADTSNSTYTTWYGLYNAASKFTTSSVKSSMIWGSQWDRVMKWMQEDSSTADYVMDSTNKGKYGGSSAKTGSSDNYKVKNIYDMAGNVYDWTLETRDNLYRVVRGGAAYTTNGLNAPASCREDGTPSETYSYVGLYVGSRSTLYIKCTED